MSKGAHDTPDLLAAMTVRRLQNAILDASPEPLYDDATLLMLAPHAALADS